MSVRTGVDEYNQPTSDINSGYIGEIKMFGFSGVPAHCLACDGSEVSRVTYKELFEVFGETYGAGDGETTFNLPDFRGYFLRGAGGNAAAMGTAQEDAIRNITGNIGYRSGQDSSTQIVYGCSGAFIISDYAPLATSYTINDTRSPTATVHFEAASMVPTAAENRPINFAVNICVVYE